ncbi:hypothetical protein AB0H42_24335 [Nocardia sp. NPDC050799]|uniref:hypothetical protein n=1 Tax=Nocardia sp. NPDC050799 TaxID=3154842 RepID=UPI0033DD584C
MTRPRKRKNADNHSGFTVIDPGGNWIESRRYELEKPIGSLFLVKAGFPGPPRSSRRGSSVIAVLGRRTLVGTLWAACYGYVVLGSSSRLELRINRLERKLDLIMQHLKIEDPESLDFTEIDDLLRRDKKIEAVKRFRALDPAAGLKEAVAAVEARARTL